MTSQVEAAWHQSSAIVICFCNPANVPSAFESNMQLWDWKNKFNLTSSLLEMYCGFKLAKTEQKLSLWAKYVISILPECRQQNPKWVCESARYSVYAEPPDGPIQSKMNPGHLVWS